MIAYFLLKLNMQQIFLCVFILLFVTIEFKDKLKHHFFVLPKVCTLKPLLQLTPVYLTIFDSNWIPKIRNPLFATDCSKLQNIH